MIGIVFHPRERFGHPASTHGRPADTHPCWQVGWVCCDYLPLCVEVLVDWQTHDYTGLGKPGAYHLEPTKDSWDLPHSKILTASHPGAPRAKRVKVTSRRDATISVNRTQVPLAPEHQATYQNIQGP